MTQYASLTAKAVAVILANARPAPRRRRLPPKIAFRRARGALIPADQDFSMTADHVHEVPRDVRVIPTGVLDEKGSMICRVIVPIKQQLGINTGGNAWTGEAEEDVVLMQTADMIRFSDCGIGIESVGLDELEDGEDEDGDES